MNIFDAIATAWTSKEKPFIQNSIGATVDVKLKPVCDGEGYEVYLYNRLINNSYQLKPFEYKDESWQPVE
jgi:hypothetical protein